MQQVSILKNETRSRIQSKILDFFRTNGWKDADDFSIRLADEAHSDLTALSLDDFSIERTLGRIKTIFFMINKLPKKKFLKLFKSELEPSLKETARRGSTNAYLYPNDLFSKMGSISDKEAETHIPDIRGREESLRNGLSGILRELGASAIPLRGKDSALEVADIELFRMKVRGITQRIAMIVKGFDSVKGMKLNHEAIAHQIERAFQRGNPDHVIIASAKEPVDGLITSLEEYAESVGKPNLITFIPPLDFIKILLAYNAL